MSKTVKEHCFAHFSVISQLFWLFLGSFRRVNPCRLRVRVDAGMGAGQAELPVGYPRQSLITILNATQAALFFGFFLAPLADHRSSKSFELTLNMSHDPC